MDFFMDVHLLGEKPEDFFKALNSLIFDQIPIPINFIDAEARIRGMNKAFLDFLKVSREEVEGKLITDIDPTVRLPIVLKTGKAEIGTKHIFRDGQRAIVHRIPLFHQGQIIGGVGIILLKDFEYFYNMGIEHEMIKSIQKNKSAVHQEAYTAKYGLDDIISLSPVTKKCKKNAFSYAQTDFPVLISGESGVGKELFAHAIHKSSPRKEGAFIRINCGAIPENLIESELFGYEKGAFTGASISKKGKFELAHNGTLFLDEAGDLPLSVQVKLLRVLQEKEVERVGGNRLIPVDVRVIAATNKNLEKEVEQGRFRRDLFYRLYVLNLFIPPLRERAMDVPLLVNHFTTLLQHQYGIYKRLAEPALNLLKAYHWPGNIRELKNIVERMVITSELDELYPEDLPDYIRSHVKNKKLCEYSQKASDQMLDLKEALDYVERHMIITALKRNNGNKAQSAADLNIPRMSLYRKLEKYNINPESEL